MKRCQKCGREFAANYDYCLDDGTPLISLGGYYPSDEQPTQVVNRQTPVYPAPQQPKWIFPVIGILCGLVVALGILAFWKISGPDTAQKNNGTQETNRPAASDRPPETPTPTPSTPVPPPPTPRPPPRRLDNSTVRVDSPRDGYLALKEGPCTSPCRTLLKIPHGTTLYLSGCKDAVEVADRRNGRWCSTSFDGYSGWIFDAFVVQ